MLVAAAVLVAGDSRPAEVTDASVFRRAGAAPVAERTAVLEAGALAGVDAVAGETAVTEAFEADLRIVASRWKCKDRTVAVLAQVHKINNQYYYPSDERANHKQ